MNAKERTALSEVERVSGLLGVPELHVARWLDADAREICREEHEREAARQAAIERHEDAAFAHAHANRELGLPEGTTMAERLALLNPSSDEVTRDPAAAYGSSANPAFYVSTSGGGLVDIGYKPPGQVQRSLSEEADDALIARAKAQQADSYMLIQRSQAQSRRKHAAWAAEDAEARRQANQYCSTDLTRASGLGWPEISR